MVSKRRRCKTCKWWRSNDRHPGWGTCVMAESDDGRPIRQTKAYAVDYETWHAELWTHDDFGCTQWAPQGE